MQISHHPSEKRLLIEILKHTPSWVYVLFFALLAWGYFQSKDRTVSRGRVALLPVAMIGLSIYGVLSAFGFVVVGLGCWFIGVALAVGLGLKFANPHGVIFSAETESFFVPGSWLPLTLMMAIFFTKYVVGVILARQLSIAGEPVFVGSISLCYGLFSGVFLARAAVIWLTTEHTTSNPASHTDTPRR